MVSDLQAQGVTWKRKTASQPVFALFQSIHVINLPSAETLQKGDFEFEVSHRFIPPMSNGYDDFYGLDGPANIRLALGYGVSNRLFIVLGRTNVSGNVDLQAKYKAFEIENDIFPSMIALQGAMVWNTKVSNRSRGDSRNFQYSAQLIWNTMIGKKLGIGIVPSYLYNSAIYNDDVKQSFTLGNYLQYYFTSRWSVILEWNPTVSGWQDSYNSAAIGVEINTGGHFFKFFFTNSDKINASQYISGADLQFTRKNLRFGFMITRLI
jgi:hypothetical protein